MENNLKETGAIELNDQELEKVSGGNFRDDMLQLVPLQCPGKDCTNNNLRSRCNVTQLTFACIRVQCLDCGSSFTFYKNN